MAELVTAFRPDWVSPPGDTILDLLKEHGGTQVELAKRTGYTTKHISLLINGKAPISEDTAIKLERVLGGNARFWMTREAHYRESLARDHEKECLQSDAAWLKKLPLKDMICFGWIWEFVDKGEQVAECFRFFGVASVATWEREHAVPRVAFRASLGRTGRNPRCPDGRCPQCGDGMLATSDPGGSNLRRAKAQWGGRVNLETAEQPHVQGSWNPQNTALPLNFRNAMRCLPRPGKVHRA